MLCGRVYGTGDPSLDGGACSIRISGGRIVDVERGERRVAGGAPGERRIDLRDRTAVPGFIDSHNHQPSAARDALEIATAHVQSIEGLVQELRELARRLPSTDWMVTERNLTRAQLDERRFPTAAELDRASTTHPIVVRFGAHAAVLNHQGLARSGLGSMRGDPPGGRVERDRHGRPTGAVHEHGALRYLDVALAPRSDEQLTDSLAAVQRDYTQTGITSVRVPGVRSGELGWYQTLRRRQRQLATRTFACVRLDPNLSPEEKRHFIDTWEVATGFGDDWLALDALKIFVDGGVEAHDDGAQFLLGEQELTTVVGHAVSRGWSVTCHAVTSRAVDMVLDAFEVARCRAVAAPRLSIEHGLFITDEQLRRAARTRTWLSTQPALLEINAHIMRDGRRGAARACPIRSALDAGVAVALGSDWNATPRTHLRPFSPLRTLAAAVRPRPESIAAATALDLHTRAGGMLVGRRRLGRIARGCPADLVLFDGRPDVNDLTHDETRSPSEVYVAGTALVRDGRPVEGVLARTVDDDWRTRDGDLA